jgi:CBS domain-containing protein
MPPGPAGTTLEGRTKDEDGTNEGVAMLTREIMTARPASGKPETPAEDCARLMEVNKIGCLPVVTPVPAEASAAPDVTSAWWGS